MNNTRTLLTTLLAAPVLLALTLPVDEVAFGPEAGSSVTRVYTSNNQFSLDEMEMSMNGQPMPMDLEMSMDMSMDLTIEVTDTFVAVSDGRPDKLQRTYDALGTEAHFSMEMSMMPDGGQDKNISSSSDLEGKTVLFTWDDEEGEYGVEYHESEGDEELLEGLTEDMDFRALLPEGGVSVGDTWEIDPKALISVLFPGGNTGLVPEEEGGSEEMMPGMDGMGANISDMLGDLLEGEASAEYMGTEDVDGTTVAVIHFTISIASSNDMTEIVEESMGDLPEGSPEISINYVDVEIEMEGEGTLQWDLAANRMHSYESQGSMNTLMDMGMGVSMGDNEMEMEQSMEMSGTFASSMTVEAN